jgi:quercetin dioxygenase-like cupin family protein
MSHRSKIDHSVWMQQPRMLSERVRGLPLIWTPDVKWFNNDWLGPTPHVHDDATEIAFLAQGSLEIEIGGSKRVYRTGDFMIMPPNKYHNYWFSGDETVCFFVAVGPNHKHNRLRHDGFTPDNFEGDAPYANVYDDVPLPSNEHFQVEKITLHPGESEAPTVIDFKDRIVYIVSGTAHIRVNTLAGTLAANQYQHIPATTPHQISNPGYEPLVLISMVITDPYTARGTAPQEDE